MTWLSKHNVRRLLNSHISPDDARETSPGHHQYAPLPARTARTVRSMITASSPSVQFCV